MRTLFENELQISFIEAKISCDNSDLSSSSVGSDLSSSCVEDKSFLDHSKMCLNDRGSISGLFFDWMVISFLVPFFAFLLSQKSLTRLS